MSKINLLDKSAPKPETFTPTELMLIEECVRKGYVVFAPRNELDLRKQYPELSGFPELSHAKITSGDMLFLWYFRCACSPFFSMADRDKLDICIVLAYKGEAIREKRRLEWKDLKFDAAMKSAMERMASINTSVRIKRFQASKILIDNAMVTIAEPLPKNPDERAAYWANATKAQTALANVSAELEAGSYGVEEVENTVLVSIKNVLKEHRVNGTAP